MKISLNWVKEFTSVKVPNDELVAKIGAQLGVVEEATDLSKAYEGVVIVKVVKVDSHINADKLHVCLIDDGGVTKNVDRFENGGYVQVVCGALNVQEGQLVAWVPPGSIVPSTHKYSEQMVIDTREVRGVVSDGMLASAKELALGSDHNGIMVIEDDVKPGTSLVEHYQLDDLIVTIENKMFTHRPDCFGVLGVAREIAGIQNIEFKSPSWYLKADLPANPKETTLPIAIKNELPDLCPRFMAVAMSNVKIKPSPAKLQAYLTRLGVRPVNNVVDITNYVMLLTSQPLHAYDYDKVLAQDPGAKVATLGVRYPKKDEELLLLNGKKVKPGEKAMLITSQTTALGLAGVMGGGDTEVSDSTKNILLECAVFDLYSIRKTSMQNGVFTDAVTRYSKGQSPLQCPCVLAHTIAVLQELAEAKVASPVIDDDHSKAIPAVAVSADFINQRLGSALEPNEIAKLLQNVEFNVTVNGSNLTVQPPFWRMDIAIAEDVVEEIGRLYGYDKLPQELPARTLKPVKRNNMFELKAAARRILSAAGANEVLTYSFVHGNTLKKAGQDPAKAFALGNALSPDLQYYRPSLLPSLLEKVHPNIKAGFDNFALFEMNKVHIKDWLDAEHLPKEESRLGFVYVDSNKPKDQLAYYWVLNYVAELLAPIRISAELINLPNKAELAINEQLVAPFAKERTAIIVTASGELLGVIGEFKPQVTREFKLPPFCGGFELDLDVLLKYREKVSDYWPLAKYPKVEQDITLQVDADLEYIKVMQSLRDAIWKLTSDLLRITVTDIYQPDADKAHKNVTFHVTASSDEKTLKAEEVNEWLDKAAEDLGKQIGAKRI
jgi:phenylalanyl-tRNA synthetase beta chain